MNAYSFRYSRDQQSGVRHTPAIVAKDRYMGRVSQNSVAKFIAKTAADSERDNQAGNARSYADDRDDRGKQGKSAAAGE